MTSAEKLYQLIQTLPEQQISEILNFAEFLQQRNPTTPQPTATTNPATAQNKRAEAIQTMRGLLKTQQPAPTDQQVATLLEERRIEKFGS